MIIISASDLGSLEQVQFSLTRFSKIISQICIANVLSKTFSILHFLSRLSNWNFKVWHVLKEKCDVHKIVVIGKKNWPKLLAAIMVKSIRWNKNFEYFDVRVFSYNLLHYRQDFEKQEGCVVVAQERLTESCVTMEWLLAQPRSLSNLPEF